MSISSARALLAAASDGTLRPVTPFRRLALCCGLCAAVALGCSDAEAPTPPPEPQPVAIVLSVPDSVLTRGEAVQFTAALVDSAGVPIPGSSFTWNSQYPAVATISTAGLVTGVDVGDSRVSVTSAGLIATQWVQVRDTIIAERMDLPGEPFGLALHGGRVLVTRLVADSVARVELPGLTVSDGASTGMYPTGVAFNPAGTRAYVTSQDGMLTVLDPGTMSVLKTAQFQGALQGVLASGPNNLWVTNSDFGVIYRLDPVTLQILDSAMTPAGDTWIAAHPTLPRLYVNGILDGTIYEFDSQTLDSLRGWNVGAMPQGMVVSADGATLYVANEGGWLDRIALGGGNILPRIALGAGGFGLTLSPDGSRLGISLSFGGRVVIMSTATLTVVQSFDGSGDARRLEFTADGTHLVVANQSGWVDYIR
jgi:DNA-binding beta-propeller fold protein YncE